MFRRVMALESDHLPQKLRPDGEYVEQNLLLFTKDMKFTLSVYQII
jgi:hypothetical protein